MLAKKMSTAAGLMLTIGVIYMAACSKPKPLYLEENDVLVKHAELVPQSMTIIQGMSVVWVNEDTVRHTIVSGTPDNRENNFPTQIIDPGKRVKVPFDSTGNFLYFCTEHPKDLVGLIVVAKDTVVKDTIQL
jgi:plastocyanin